ncbi:MAG: hypothetical protein U0271_15280 [Polyangiaceae bacterium]
MGKALAILGALIAGIALGFVAYRFAPNLPIPGLGAGSGSAAATVAPSASAPAASASSTAPLAASSVAPSASAPSATVSASAPGPADANAPACLASLFPESTFPDPSVLGFVCGEADAVKGANHVQDAILAAAPNGMSAARKEWAVLSYYELAAYTTLRARCCPSAPATTAPEAPKGCPNLGEALTKIAAVSVPGSSDADIKPALKAFEKVAYCLSEKKAGDAFGGSRELGGNESRFFLKTLGRARGAEPPK